MPRLASLINNQLTGKVTYTVAPLPPQYFGIEFDSPAYNEGSIVTATVTTSNVANGTTVGYSILGLSANDITAGSLTGTITINSNTGSTQLTLRNDVLTEGTDTMLITLDATDSAGTSTGNLSTQALVLDTSNDPNTVLWLDNEDSPTTVRSIIGGTSMQINGVFLSNPSVPRTVQGRTSGAQTTITAITANTGSFIEVDDTGNSTSFVIGEQLNLVYVPITVVSSYVTGTSASSSITRAGITQSMSFSGSQTQSLSIADNPAFATFPLTIEAWIYSGTTAGTILNLQNTSTGQNMAFRNHTLTQADRSSATVAQSINGTTWPNNAWQHIAFTLWSTTGSTTVADRITYFVNGSANGTTNGGLLTLPSTPTDYTATNQTRILLGMNQFSLASANSPWTGFVSEVRVSRGARYGTAISASPIFFPNSNIALDRDVNTLALIRAV